MVSLRMRQERRLKRYVRQLGPAGLLLLQLHTVDDDVGSWLCNCWNGAQVYRTRKTYAGRLREPRIPAVAQHCVQELDQKKTPSVGTCYAYAVKYRPKLRACLRSDTEISFYSRLMLYFTRPKPCVPSTYIRGHAPIHALHSIARWTELVKLLCVDRHCISWSFCLRSVVNSFSRFDIFMCVLRIF